MERVQLPGSRHVKARGTEWHLIFHSCFFGLWGWDAMGDYTQKKERLFTFKPAVINPFPQSDRALFMWKLI